MEHLLDGVRGSVNRSFERAEDVGEDARREAMEALDALEARVEELREESGD
ncbi:MAG: hypothetical protein V5A23_06615 [Halobacteriales archaeon]